MGFDWTIAMMSQQPGFTRYNLTGTATKLQSQQVEQIMECIQSRMKDFAIGETKHLPFLDDHVATDFPLCPFAHSLTPLDISLLFESSHRQGLCSDAWS
jgi:hypothetical protein